MPFNKSTGTFIFKGASFILKLWGKKVHERKLLSCKTQFDSINITSNVTTYKDFIFASTTQIHGEYKFNMKITDFPVISIENEHFSQPKMKILWKFYHLPFDSLSWSDKCFRWEKFNLIDVSCKVNAKTVNRVTNAPSDEKKVGVREWGVNA